MACVDAPARRAIPSEVRSCIPWVMWVFSKKASPSPSAWINSSSCSIWSLSLIESAFAWSSQTSRTVFMHGSICGFGKDAQPVATAVESIVSTVMPVLGPIPSCQALLHRRPLPPHRGVWMHRELSELRRRHSDSLGLCCLPLASLDGDLRKGPTHRNLKTGGIIGGRQAERPGKCQCRCVEASLRRSSIKTCPYGCL